MQNNLVYLVEGQTEKKVVETLKSELFCVKPGRISVLNVVQQPVSRTLFASLRGQITSVLLFDTDNDGEGMLKKNIEKLRALPNIRDVICIPQVKNLEDELCYSCQLRDIRELTNSKSKSDVKRDLLRLKNLPARLEYCGFSIQRLWSRNAPEEFAIVENRANVIKIYRK